MGKGSNGFSLLELLIVITIVLTIAAIAIPNLHRSRIAANQASAVASLQALEIAEVTYAATYGGGFSVDMKSLAPPVATGATPSSTAAGLVDSTLASGIKSGYNFTYSPGGIDASGRINTFSFIASPISGWTGTNHYYTDESGVIRKGGATAPGSTEGFSWGETVQPATE
jgi:type IV pilus assembly protein PilA